MNSRFLGRARVLCFLAVAVLGFCCGSLQATPLTAELSCVFATAGSSCVPGSTWGTITLDGEVPGHIGEIQVTVDLVQPDMKFRDLMLYFSFPSDPAVVSITSGDGQVSLIPDGFSLVPYTGLFDVGGTGTQGWHGDNGYTTFLTGWSGTGGTGSQVNLTVDMFDSPDALDTAVHLQAVLNLPSGATSIKLGGDFGAGGGGGGEPVPEPASALLLGCGLIAIAWALRHRKAS